MLAATLLSTFVLAPQDPATQIRRLASASPSEHAAAAKELEAIGEPALKALRALSHETGDRELAARAEQVIGGIELAHPGGLVIAFTRGEAKACELWIWKDGVEVALTKNALMECEPALSPDGTRLAYARTPDHHDFGLHEIVVRELATGKEVSFGKGRSPCWSPDGSVLAIARDSAITLLTVGKDEERKLGTDLGGGLNHATWSPNGRFLGVESKEGIVIFDAASGKEHTRIDGTPQGTHSLYNFSLGDGLVSMVSGNGPYEWDVFVTALHEGKTRKLTERSFRHGMTSLSPIDDFVLCLKSTPDAQGYGTYLIDVATGAERQVFASASPLLRATWSPEGRFVVFAAADDTLQLLHVRSGRTRALTRMGVGYGPATTWFAPSVWFACGRALPKIGPASK